MIFFKCQLERPETKEVKLESLFNIFSIVNLFTFRETEGEKKEIQVWSILINEKVSHFAVLTIFRKIVQKYDPLNNC